jgi:hypothetical protein
MQRSGRSRQPRRRTWRSPSAGTSQATRRAGRRASASTSSSSSALAATGRPRLATASLSAQPNGRLLAP